LGLFCFVEACLREIYIYAWFMPYIPTTFLGFAMKILNVNEYGYDITEEFTWLM